MVKVVIALLLLSAICSAALARSQNYYIRNDDGTVCLRMNVSISVNVTYQETSKENTSMLFNLTDEAPPSNPRDTCNPETRSAQLYIFQDDGDEMSPFLGIEFSFTGKDADHWSMGEIRFSLDTGILINYDGNEGNYTFTTTNKLHQDANAQLGSFQSYTCSKNQDLVFNASDALIYPVATVQDLQVQAFKFKNSTTGEFDSAQDCQLDSTSAKANKIVPIAVGAALAGLVVVVLIAYLIGRLRSRRQSSYEALS